MTNIYPTTKQTDDGFFYPAIMFNGKLFFDPKTVLNEDFAKRYAAIIVQDICEHMEMILPDLWGLKS